MLQFKPMKLYINTKDKDTIHVALKSGGKVMDSLTDHNKYGSQVLLPLIEKILKKNKLQFKDLKEIEVETGPGSFTGLRVGVAVANALGFGLKIPVNGKKTELVLEYS